MSECGECEKVLKPTKGSPSIYCAFCKNKYHKTCNRYNLIYQENETETIVWCRNCVRNKFNERDQTLADHEKQLSSLVDKVKDLTDKMNELINQKIHQIQIKKMKTCHVAVSPMKRLKIKFWMP